MITHTLHKNALGVIQNFLHLPISKNGDSSAGPNCPYYNNRRSGMHGGLRVLVGKGSVEDITEEATLMGLREKIALKNLTGEAYKKFLVDHRLGIDCSGLAYYILDAESMERNKGRLRSHVKHPYAKHIVRKFLCMLRPIENTGVTTLAHEKNSREIKISEVMPGDIIVMLYTGLEKKYHHVLIVHQVDYSGNPNPQTKKIYYTHSFAWPTDGKYNHGVRQGIIEIIDSAKPIGEQLWTENGTDEQANLINFTQEKAREAMYVSVRRLNWF